ncbi:alpha/beta fold hydrolase [Gymnodinialimonas ceratoperidinii]|uniref:Alpha/beta fold hydrolase n=1 Tax=Gymnodinialimonas ceratoperidinii TaxID=2856823 RepID=A0A8F6TT39_9RHOB|nr:alpha/beta fold hydrolase [Gymnodinialimonas ceratoperidinii]QXT38190.1 alpha/beta fold hydrolase [Gymnodinialimonas ceratoperidinii]
MNTAPALPLLLIPGMMCDARLFAPQIAAFSSHRSVMVANLTGQETIAGFAEDILENAPPRFALAGLSMGGIVAMEIMARAPERVSHLALLDTNPLAEPLERARARLPQIEAVQAGGLRRIMRDEMKPNYLADGPRVGEILDLCMEMAEALGAEAFVQQSCALATRPDQMETLAQIAVPTLVLCGSEDGLCPPERHRLMRDTIPGAHLDIIEGAGHLPTLEQPDRTNAALASWLQRPC